MNNITVLPKLQKITISSSFYELKETYKIFFDEENFDNILKSLKKFISFSETKIDDMADIIFKKNKDLKKTDEYKLTVSTENITIEYEKNQGAFYAVCTLKQLFFGKSKINIVKIDDYADFEIRGLMYDVSRGKLPKTESIKEIIDIISELKYNHFELYFESFVFEYTNFPKHCENKTVLTRKDIQELLEYAKSRYVDLVPNQNGLGHMETWTNMEEFKHLAITDDNGKITGTLNPLKEETLNLMDRIYDCLLDNFDSPYFNIGLDEPQLGIGNTKEDCEKFGKDTVYINYLNKLCTLIKEKYGRKPMFWDDVVFENPQCIKKLPKDAIVLEWGYETEHRFEKRCRTLSENSLDFIVCPGTSSWGSVTGRSNNMLVNIYTACECAKRYNAKGVMLTDWEHGCGGQSIISCYLPYVFCASLSWNCDDPDTGDMIMARNKLLNLSIEYTDKFIFKTKNSKSVANILYKMGNYYLLDERLIYNTTMLWTYSHKNTGQFPIPIEDINFSYIYAVKNYMNDIKKEINDEIDCENSDIIIRKMRLLSDIVVFLCDLITRDFNDEMRQELNALKKEYGIVWDINNFAENKYTFFESFLNDMKEKNY